MLKRVMIILMSAVLPLCAVEVTVSGIGAGDLAKAIGITPANLSILKNGKAKAVRFTTLEALCRELKCQPGDILEYVPEEGSD